MKFLVTYADRFPWAVIIATCVGLGLAPFVPEPHLTEKLRMLFHAELTDPLDVFDLVLHALPFAFVLLRWAAVRGRPSA